MTVRRPLLAALALIVVTAAGLAGWQLALRGLEQAVRDALGPGGEVQRLRVGWTAVELEGLRVKAQAGWPAADELRAEHVSLRPDWRALFGGWRSGAWGVPAIRVERGYVSLRRGADGRLQLLPSLLARPAAPSPTPAAASAPAGPSASLTIGRIELADSAVELFDASVRQPPHRVRLEALQATLGPLTLPPTPTQAPLQLALRATLKGPQHDGRLQLDGWLHPTRRDADLQARADGVDLLALQPYLFKAGDGGVRRGTLDLRLHAQVDARQHLHAPGTLVLRGLELADGASGRLAGVPRQLVLAALERDGRIELRFTLDGRLDDPAFSINESLLKRVAGGLAEALGVRLSGVVEGVGQLFKGLLGR